MADAGAGSDGYYRLTEEFVRRVEASANDWPKRWLLYSYIRERIGGCPNEYDYKRMKNKEPVPWCLAEGIARYFGESLDRVAVPAPAVDRPDDALDAFRADRGGWPKLHAWALRRFELPKRHLCRRAEQVHEAAREVVRQLGRHNLKVRRTEAEERRVGEGALGLSSADYGEYLRRWWVFDPRTVLRSDAGVTALFPLTDAQGAAYLAGRVHDNDLRPEADTPRRSRYLLINAFSEAEGYGGLGKAAASTTLLNMLFSQAAAFSPLLWSRAPQPTFLSFDRSPVNTKRGSLYGFRPNGARTPVTGNPVLVLGPPRGRPKGADRIEFAMNYHALLYTVRLYQTAADPEWDRDE